MSEKINHRIESGETHKLLTEETEHTQKHEKVITDSEREHGQENHIDKLRVEAAEHAAKTEPLKTINQTENIPENQHPLLINKQLKDMSYTRSLIRARKKLSRPGRLFSKAVHSNILDKPSETIGKTVARPSVMLGGAIFAFLGTSLLLWVTKKYGYEYNYLVAIGMFAVGMLAGIIIEGLLKSIRRNHKN